jgi:Predicted transcriptional regulators
VRWHVNPHSGVPLYVQIEEQIKTAIASGVLQPGDRLPAVRELALELTINPNTVARAYRELERAGLIDTTPGRGTFVKAAQAPPMAETERRQRLAGIVRLMVTEARALGFSDDDIVAAVQAALRGEEA